MKDKLRRFMMGRYGVDELNRFLMWIAVVCLILNLFFSSLWYVGAILFLVFCYYRMFSKNISRRFAENQTYLKLLFRVKEAFGSKQFHFREMIKYHIYKCPGCGQKIRVPRGKGKISIHCPKCNTDFIKHS